MHKFKRQSNDNGGASVRTRVSGEEEARKRNVLVSSWGVVVGSGTCKQNKSLLPKSFRRLIIPHPLSSSTYHPPSPYHNHNGQRTWDHG